MQWKKYTKTLHIPFTCAESYFDTLHIVEGMTPLCFTTNLVANKVAVTESIIKQNNMHHVS